MCCRTILATTDFFSQCEATNRADMIVYIVVFLNETSIQNSDTYLSLYQLGTSPVFSHFTYIYHRTQIYFRRKKDYLFNNMEHLEMSSMQAEH